MTRWARSGGTELPSCAWTRLREPTSLEAVWEGEQTLDLSNPQVDGCPNGTALRSGQAAPGWWEPAVGIQLEQKRPVTAAPANCGSGWPRSSV